MRVAVVGTGIAGLAAARALDPSAEVHLFEAADRPGGHARTIVVEDGGSEHAIDVGFIVYNRRNYPRFSGLLDRLGVDTAPTSMSVSVSCPDGFELGAETVGGLLARRRNALDPRLWALVVGQLRFARAGARALAAGTDESIGELCARLRLPRAFVDRYLLPMAGAIWSAPPGEVAALPAATLLAFFRQHGLLTLTDRPQWRTVVGGSRRYVEALVADLRGTLHLGRPVRRIERPGPSDPAGTGGPVRLVLDDGEARFDRAIVAVHSDRALQMLGSPTAAEREVLGSIRYRDNDVVLHRDPSLLPRRRRAWAAWNVRLDGDQAAGIGVSYWMNRLQPIAAPSTWCVTLNRTRAIDPAAIAWRGTLAHPQLDRDAVAAQRRWREIDGTGGVHYAGAYWRWGFHEDGAWSGERAAEAVATAARVAA